MNYGIAFTPLVPTLVLWLAIGAIVVIAALLLLGRSRSAWIRVTALALIALALANPQFTREDREPLSSVAAVVVDGGGCEARAAASLTGAFAVARESLAGVGARVSRVLAIRTADAKAVAMQRTQARMTSRKMRGRCSM